MSFGNAFSRLLAVDAWRSGQLRPVGVLASLMTVTTEVEAVPAMSQVSRSTHGTSS
jgi:hypothetical protein